MSQELYYTSAPSGLRPGSRGFCTVMSTSGMAKNLADRLEALSGYRHVFPPNDPNAAFNPVAYSHLKINVGGVPLHVLSRISAAGLDYTQRSNKFAHHVVLDGKELVPGGPAAVLAAPGFMESTWNGEPRVIGLGRKPPQVQAPPAVCHTWAKLTGDAGWGGVLAETALGGPGKVATVIFEPGMDTLALVAEALALLPENMRWQVTFSTYYTKLPPEVQCQWRFVLKGSPEAKAAERGGSLVIPLGSPKPIGVGGDWAVAAREGTVALLPQDAASELRDRPAEFQFEPSALRPGASLTSEPDRLEQPFTSLPAPPRLTDRRSRRLQRASWIIPTTGGVLFVVLLAGVYSLTYQWFKAAPEVAAVEGNSSKQQPSHAAEANEVSEDSTDEKSPSESNAYEKPLPKEDANEQQPTEIPRQTPPSDVAPILDNVKDQPGSLQASEIPEAPLNGPIQPNLLISFPIPALPQGAAGRLHKVEALPAEINLEPQVIGGHARLLGGEAAHSIWKFEMVADHNSPKVFKVKMGLKEASGYLKPIEVGSFTVGDQLLSFTWNRKETQGIAAEAKMAAEHLRNCVLAVEKSGHRVGYSLRSPVDVDVIYPVVGASGDIVVKDLKMIPEAKLSVKVPVLPAVWSKHNGMPPIHGERPSATITANLDPNSQYLPETNSPKAELKLAIELVKPKQKYQLIVLHWKCTLSVDGVETTAHNLNGKKTSLNGNIRDENPKELAKSALPKASQERIDGFERQIAMIDAYLRAIDEVAKSPVAVQIVALIEDVELILAASEVKVAGGVSP